VVVRGRGRVAMAGGRERWGKGTKDVREVREKGTGTVRLNRCSVLERHQCHLRHQSKQYTRPGDTDFRKPKFHSHLCTTHNTTFY
jgi:hypothetical protein